MRPTLSLRQLLCPLLPLKPSTNLSSASITTLPSVDAMRSVMMRMVRESSCRG